MYILNKRKCNIPGNLFLWQSDCRYFPPIYTTLRASTVANNLYWGSAHRKGMYNLIKGLIINLVGIAINCHNHIRCTNVHPNADAFAFHNWNFLLRAANSLLFYSLTAHIVSVYTSHSKTTLKRNTLTHTLSALAFREKCLLPSLCPSVSLYAYPSVRLYHRGSHWVDIREIWCWKLLWKSVGKIQIWLKSGGRLGHFTWRLKHLLLLPATLNLHKGAFFDWNGTRMFGWSRRYKHYANAPHCYVTRILTVLLIVQIS